MTTVATATYGLMVSRKVKAALKARQIAAQGRFIGDKSKPLFPRLPPVQPWILKSVIYMHPISPFRRNHKQMQTLAVQFASDAGEENQSSWAMPIRHVSAGARSRLCLSDKRNHKANCFAALPRRIVTPWPGFMTKPPGSFSRPPCARPRLFPPHHRRRNLLANPTATAPLIPNLILIPPPRLRVSVVNFPPVFPENPLEQSRTHNLSLTPPFSGVNQLNSQPP